MSKLPILAAALGVSESYLISGDHLTLQTTKQKPLMKFGQNQPSSNHLLIKRPLFYHRNTPSCPKPSP